MALFQVLLNTWRPKGSHMEEIMYKHLGGSLEFTNNEHKRTTKQKIVSMGTIELRLSVITRYFDRYGIQC